MALKRGPTRMHREKELVVLGPDRWFTAAPVILVPEDVVLLVAVCKVQRGRQLVTYVAIRGAAPLLETTVAKSKSSNVGV